MIFRRIRTVFVVLIIASLALAVLLTLPYLNEMPQSKGEAQPSSASYPLRSTDRSLLDLNGDWLAFNSLNDAENLLGPLVGADRESNGLDTQAFKNLPLASIPGTWRWKVAARQFALSNELSGRTFRLHILGTSAPFEVYLNGFSAAELVGAGTGENAPMVIDIPTPRFKFGQVNTLAIKLKEPLAGGGPYFSVPGMTGEAYLEASGPILIDAPAFATKVSGNGTAELNFNIPIKGALRSGSISGQIALVDSKGSVAATTDFAITTEQTAALGKLTVAQAKLWSPADPYLYRLEVKVNSAGGVRDSYYLPIGLRELRFDNGFILNGKKFELQAVQLVNDFTASQGSALESDIKWAKSRGYNGLYLPDRPAQPYLLDLADRYGMLVLGQSSVGWARVSADWQRNSRELAAQLKYLGYHSALGALGLGTEVDNQNAAVSKYLKQTAGGTLTFYSRVGSEDSLIFNAGGEIQLKAPFLADYLAAKPSTAGLGYLEAHTNRSGILNRDRTEKNAQNSGQQAPAIPDWIPLAAGTLAIALLALSWGRSSLTLKKLKIAEKKRQLRNEIWMQVCWYVLRWMVLALVVTQTFLEYASNTFINVVVQSLPTATLQVLAWYLLDSPWVLASTLFGIGLIFSLVLALPRAQSLPESPGTIAAVLWLEKRKRWIVPAIGVWIWSLFGGPFWLVWVVLGAGYLFSKFLGSRDIRNAEGKPYTLLYLGGFVVIILSIIVINWEVIKYLYHWANM